MSRETMPGSSKGPVFARIKNTIDNRAAYNGTNTGADRPADSSTNCATDSGTYCATDSRTDRRASLRLFLSLIHI